jgi:hypothetical protein
VIQRALAAGQVHIARMPAPEQGLDDVPGGEIHHWWGAVHVPGVSLGPLLAYLKDYDRHAGAFADVQQSKLIARDGDRYRFFFRLKRSKAFVTVHLNTEQVCVYREHGPARASSRSEALRITEVEGAGTEHETERPPGDDRGFLWRLASWWRGGSSRPATASSSNWSRPA